MKRTILSTVLIVIILQSLIGCVSQARYSDYIGKPKEIALDEIKRKKSSNTAKIVINWLLAGYSTLWIASIVDTIRLASFKNDFRRVEEQIEATPPGALVGQAAPAGTSGSAATFATGVEGALARAAKEVFKSVPARSRIAIVYITAQDRSTTDYIAGELEYMWVNDGYIITDRSQLDRLRREQNFQLSGEVDDNTAVSIGKIIGASIIVTGKVDGEGNLRRLRLRALNTQTAQVVGVASERL